MIRDEGCSLVANPGPSSSSSPANYANLSIDERDELMKNLQKLFKVHQREQLELQQQPGCSSSSNTANNNELDDHERVNGDEPMVLPTGLAVADAECSPLKSTILDGKLVACFVVGGECRLCFPQMRALTLGDVSTQKVDEAMKALAITNALANEEQLLVLKKAGMLQASAARCELITKTNAERLISLLKSCGTPPPLDETERSQLPSIKVAHDCFGGCSALLYPNLVPQPCLECRTCHRMFGPEDFCRHTHQPAAGKDLCFWGFDSSNWAYYIRVDDEEAEAGGPGPEAAEHQLANFVQNFPS